MDPAPMLQALVLSLSVAALVLIQAAGYYFLIRPQAAALSTSGKLSLSLMILTFSGGLIGALPWWFSFPGSFAWTLPPLASRMLAAASLTFAAVSLAALIRPNSGKSRLYHWMLAVYMLPLSAALLLFHLDRLDFGAPIAYFFLLAVLVVDLGALWFLVRRPALPADGGEQTVLISRVWHIGLAAVAGAWGAALFITDSGPVPGIWLWPGDLLTSRLIAVMLLTLAAGAFVSLRSRSASRVMMVCAGLYGLGVAAANLWGLFAGSPPKPVYLFAFAFIGADSLLILLLDLLAGDMTRRSQIPSEK